LEKIIGKNRACKIKQIRSPLSLGMVNVVNNKSSKDIIRKKQSLIVLCSKMEIV
jgi:hypothetical protein